jgi:hypothetical protein
VSEDGVVEIEDVEHVVELVFEDGDLVCGGGSSSRSLDGFQTWH